MHLAGVDPVINLSLRRHDLQRDGVVPVKIIYHIWNDIRLYRQVFPPERRFFYIQTETLPFPAPWL